LQVLDRIEKLREVLRPQLNEPRRWQGSLRRLSFARNIRGSNSIEGYDASLDDAAAVALGEAPLDADTETRLALEGYRNSMTYVLQLAQEGAIEVSSTLLTSLHFMMTNYDLKNRPGRWRAGSIYVRDDETEEIVHEGPDVELVPELMSEYVDVVNSSHAEDYLVDAAMAHLNLVMIHPFRDGNGRMARCVQSLVLASSGMMSPVFMSIEEYLGRNTQDYYRVLAEVGGGSWNPQGDARPWIRFALTAHLRQALTLQRRVRIAERLWSELEIRVGRAGLNERTIAGVYDAAIGFRVRSSTYRASLAEAGDEISEQSASKDLRALVDAGFVIANGEKRGRFYTRSESLSDLYLGIVRSGDTKDRSDPFAT
jgi:Fic family protein